MTTMWTPAKPLRPREEACVRLRAAGFTNREIATLLGISIKTVDTHFDQVRRRLDLPDRAGQRQTVSAVLYALGRYDMGDAQAFTELPERLRALVEQYC